MSAWPFVSRARYDLLEHNARELTGQLKASLAVADARAEQAERRYEVLLDRSFALRFQRVEGTSAVVAVEPGPTAPPREPDVLKALIAEVCGSDTRKRTMMLRQLAADRAEGISSERIEAAIRNGVSADGVAA